MFQRVIKFDKKVIENKYILKFLLQEMHYPRLDCINEVSIYLLHVLSILSEIEWKS